MLVGVRRRLPAQNPLPLSNVDGELIGGALHHAQRLEAVVGVVGRARSKLLVHSRDELVSRETVVVQRRPVERREEANHRLTHQLVHGAHVLLAHRRLVLLVGAPKILPGRRGGQLQEGGVDYSVVDDFHSFFFSLAHC